MTAGNQKKIVLATGNAGKIKELMNLTSDLPIEVLSLAQFPQVGEIAETGSTFRENALLKAREVAARTSIISVADDSGLEVDCLNGAPGVYSARFAGEPVDDSRNNYKLLSLLQGVTLEQRTARFRCAIAIVIPGGKEYTTEGRCEGLIVDEARGSGGFGYDPIFFLPGLGRTMAELTLGEKNRISHRAQGFLQAVAVLKQIFEV
ncbi:MAG: XTP/dITP diphosphatase [Bacillota bacterium]